MLKKTALLAFVAAAALAGCAPQMHRATDAHKTAAVAEPPKADVRAEDLVEVKTAASNSFVLADKSGEIEVRLHLRAKANKGARRPPVNLGLVVDTSGSMAGAAIEDARAASIALLDSLAEGDRLAVVVFHSTSEVLVPSTQLTKQSIEEIRGKLRAIKAHGTTDLAGGLQAGLAEVAKSYQAQGINRVVLLGDGVPNDPNPLQGITQQAAQKRISITSLGLGLDYDETVMSKIALDSGGKYHFLKDSSQVAKVFKDEVLRLKEVVGRGVAVTVSPGPGVVVKEVVGLPTSHNGQKASVMIGDLSEGDERDIVVRLSVPGRHADSVVELLDTEVAFDLPAGGYQRLVERDFVSAKATTDLAQIEKGRDLDVAHTVAQLTVADAIVKAVAAARAGNLNLAYSLCDQADKVARTAARDFEDDELLEKAKSIGPLRKSLMSLVPTVVQPPPPGPPGGPVRPTPPVADMPRPSAAPAVVLESQAKAMSTIQGN